MDCRRRPRGLLVAVEGLERPRLCSLGDSLPLHHERVQPGQSGGRVGDEVLDEGADVALVAPVEVGGHVGRYRVGSVRADAQDAERDQHEQQPLRGVPVDAQPVGEGRRVRRAFVDQEPEDAMLVGQVQRWGRNQAVDRVLQGGGNHRASIVILARASEQRRFAQPIHSRCSSMRAPVPSASVVRGPVAAQVGGQLRSAAARSHSGSRGGAWSRAKAPIRSWSR
jgi:hypothetical protein